MSSPESSTASQPTGNGPYPARIAALGGKPIPSVDDPICGVFLLLFVCGAVLNMAIFQVNRRRGHKFILSGLCFGFCMSRIATCVMRIVWASRPDNISVGIASSIFNAAGVLILFVVNLVFAQRLLRAYHPRFGWHRAVSLAYLFLYFSVIALLIMVITATVRGFFTLDPDILGICGDIQLFAGTYLAVLAFLPVPIVLLAWAWPREGRPDKFGQGSLRSKVCLVLFTSTILTFGAGFRVGASYDPRPISNPAWYHHKAAFYCVNFVIELIVVYLYALIRFDRRFHIPNGSSAPGHYSNGVPKAEDGIAGRINSEEEAFGDDRSSTAGDQSSNGCVASVHTYIHMVQGDESGRSGKQQSDGDLEQQGDGDLEKHVRVHVNGRPRAARRQLDREAPVIAGLGSAD
ncbi:DUF3112 domain-containing protein [Candidatus Bathyarchaeota archaeon]|nr:DUF3112 domain-containing protein [Candidatus Bathyarchaeota archaeon]